MQIRGLISALLASLMLCTPSAFAEAQWLTGGLVGAGVGTAVGLGGTFVLCRAAEENTASCRQTGMPLGGALLGAAGFGIGALIGLTVKEEEWTYPDSKSGAPTPVLNPTLLVIPQSGTYGIGAVVSF